MISNTNAARTEFQAKMDGIKQYMALRKVNKQVKIFASNLFLTSLQMLQMLHCKPAITAFIF